MNCSVLIVDDDVLIAENMEAYLEDEDMTVRTFGSAEKALALINKGENFDVCIMDMRLPGMDGNQAIMHLHEISPNLKFIIHTGSNNYVIPEHLRMIGVTDVHIFIKPVRDMKLLAERIRELAAADRGERF